MARPRRAGSFVSGATMGPAVFCEAVLAYAPDSRFGVDSIPSDSKTDRRIQKFREREVVIWTQRKLGSAARRVLPPLSRAQKEILRGGAWRDAEDCAGLRPALHEGYQGRPRSP